MKGLIIVGNGMSGAQAPGERTLIVQPNAVGGVQTDYSTNFPLTENPISEGGRWIGGQSAGGNLWGDCQTTPGFAFGVSQPTTFGDPTAILTGQWGPTQSAQATVKINTTPTTGPDEVEIRLRTIIGASAMTGYEVYVSVNPNNEYCHIASWGGANGVYVNMDVGAPAIHLVNGDVLKGTVTTESPTHVTITLYVNGVQVFQVIDDGNFTFNGDGQKHGPWLSGAPGFGFYQGEAFNRFGFSNFSVTAS